MSQTRNGDWRTSSHSFDSLNCVAVRRAAEHVEVCDSKDPEGFTLAFGRQSWSLFIAGVSSNAIRPD